MRPSRLIWMLCFLSQTQPGLSNHRQPFVPPTAVTLCRRRTPGNVPCESPPHHAIAAISIDSMAITSSSCNAVESQMPLSAACSSRTVVWCRTDVLCEGTFQSMQSASRRKAKIGHESRIVHILQLPKRSTNNIGEKALAPPRLEQLSRVGIGERPYRLPPPLR